MEMLTQDFSCTREGLTIRGREYRPAGEKLPAVIISHGFMGTGSDIAGYAQQLAQWGSAAYVYDFCGGSIRSTSDGRFQDMTVLTELRDLEAVVEYVSGLPYIDGERLILMGCSQGGFVSALYAAAHPEQVERLVLFYPALCIPEDARRGNMLMYSFDPENVPELIHPEIPADLPPEIAGSMGPIGREYVTSMQRVDAFSSIAAYPGPVLIVHGDSDSAVNVVNSRRAQAAYHSVRPLRCQLAEITGANHGFRGTEDVHAMELVREFIRGGTNVLSVDVVLTGLDREEQGEETVLTIPFGGVIRTPFFTGMVQPGAADIQEGNAGHPSVRRLRCQGHGLYWCALPSPHCQHGYGERLASHRHHRQQGPGFPEWRGVYRVSGAPPGGPRGPYFHQAVPINGWRNTPYEEQRCR